MFGSILIIIAILSGFVSLINDQYKNTKKNQDKSSKQARPMKSPAPDDAEEHVTYSQKKTGKTLGRIETQEQRDDRLHELARRKNVDKEVIETSERHMVHHLEGVMRKNKPNRTRIDMNMRKNMKRSGVINSIVMSEVLGTPRALKPYQSTMKKRINK